MEIAIVTGLFTEGNMDIDAGHAAKIVKLNFLYCHNLRAVIAH